MSIIPTSTRTASFSSIDYKAKSVPKTNGGNTKPLANEGENAAEVSLSSEAIKLSGAYIGELKAAQLPQSTLRTVEFQIKLMQEVKKQNLAGQNMDSDIKDLASAYAAVSSDINQNSESSQKHVKFLDEAFKAVSNLFFTRNAQQQIKNDSFAKSLQSGVPDSDLSAQLSKAADDAKEQSSIFADSFLKNFKSLGLEGAFNLAMSLL